MFFTASGLYFSQSLGPLTPQQVNCTKGEGKKGECEGERERKRERERGSVRGMVSGNGEREREREIEGR